MRRKLQIIFQDPYSSLNPRDRLWSDSAPLEVYKVGTKEERREMVEEILQEVGLDKQYLNRFHMSFGGQRQRIELQGHWSWIRNLLSVTRRFPHWTYLSVRQVLNLMRNMQQKKNLTYLFYLPWPERSPPYQWQNRVMYLGSVDWGWQKKPSFIPIRCTPIQKPFFPQSRFRMWRRNVSVSFWKVTCQVPTIHRQDVNSTLAVPTQQTAAGRKLLCFRRWKRGIKQPATGLWSLPENLFPAICRLRKLWRTFCRKPF